MDSLTQIPENMEQAGKPVSRTTRRFNFVSAGLAFVLWGSWAWYVNTQTPPEAASTGGSASPWVSALTQGVGSFLITLLMVNIVSWLYNRLPDNALSLVLPTFITVMFTGSCMAIAHLIVGTPDVLRTIAPGVTVAVFFNLYTTYLLSRNADPGQQASRSKHA